MLQKLAKQLVAYDEASIMALWEKYQAIVSQFQPTRQWEEAVLIFNMIQSVRWKNQLFNAHWAEQQTLGEKEDKTEQNSDKQESGPGNIDSSKQKGKVLRFRPSEDDESV
jgi:hypothetical protein